jgi:hypothetical protein
VSQKKKSFEINLIGLPTAGKKKIVTELHHILRSISTLVLLIFA